MEPEPGGGRARPVPRRPGQQDQALWPAGRLIDPTGRGARGHGCGRCEGLWYGRVSEAGQPADIVLGQGDPAAAQANRGAARPTAASLRWPYGLAVLGRRVAVADSGNNRVLIWDLAHEG